MLALSWGWFRSADDTNSSRCTECDAGLHQNHTGQALCLPCVPGKYGNSSGLSLCIECDVNTYTDDTNQQECKTCDAGESTSGLKGKTTCTACSAGQYMVGNSGSCLLVLRVGFGPRMTRIPAGVPNAMGCTRIRRVGLCVPCVPGKYGNSSDSLCAECDANTYSDDTNQQECKTCNVGESNRGSWAERRVRRVPRGLSWWAYPVRA